MKFAYADRDFVVAVKPAGMPSAPIHADDFDTALFRVAKEFPDVLEVKGRKPLECGLFHRLDTATSGLLLFARNQIFYERLLLLQQEGRFRKEYTAFCSLVPDCCALLPGFPKAPHGVVPAEQITLPFRVASRFRHYGKGRSQVRPVTANSGGYAVRKSKSQAVYCTDILCVQAHGQELIVKCGIAQGFRHQVRCHLAWCGLPVVGDELYNPLFVAKPKEPLCFFATRISFVHPLDGKEICLELPVQDLI